MSHGSEQPPELDIAASEMTFEDALARLEAMVAALEKGDLTLAESLEAFREGIKNLGACVRHLDAFEEQVEVLLAGLGNDAQSAPGMPARGFLRIQAGGLDAEDLGRQTTEKEKD